MRRKRKMSLRALAETTGLTAVGLSHVETGRTKRPHVLTQRAIAEALDCRVEDLFPSGHKR
jgi:transcriptional regulator with XRE-family HTH domain